jgi:glycerol-3-phosphate dehydrogenase (NAD(P)+)
LSNIYNHTNQIGIIGGGSFGTAIANLIAQRYTVYMYLRKADSIHNINVLRLHRGQEIHPNIIATDDIQMLTEKCKLIFPVVPSYAFRSVMKQMSPFLTPAHILIHGTKGFDVAYDIENEPHRPISPKEIFSMSEVILQETPVVRVGCLSGPNLAKEISDLQPAATVIASRYEEVVRIGQDVLQNDRFQVYGSLDIRGIELAGVLKNYIAIAAGALAGKGYGENVRALLITRGMAEMIHIGKALNIPSKSFLGLAGIGDLIATCCSPLSRNYSVGYKLSKGEKLPDIIASMTEAAEGIKTVQVMKNVADYLKISAPLVGILYKIFYKNYTIDRGIQVLMRLPVSNDAEYV